MVAYRHFYKESPRGVSAGEGLLPVNGGDKTNAIDVFRLIGGLLVLPLLLYLPGAAILHSIGRRAGGWLPFAGRDEWIFVAVAASLLVTGVLGLVLAQVGLFSWWLLLVLTLLVSALINYAGRDLYSGLRSLPSTFLPPAPGPRRLEDRRQARAHHVALIAIGLLAAGLFSRPAEMLRGALDSGVYVNAGVAIGRTGAILQRDPLMRQLNDDAGEGRQVMQELNRDRYTLYRLRMPGFYVYDKKASLVVPQHYSLYPVWIGAMYSLFGIWGALYASPLLALLFVFAIYFFARRALSPGAALLGLLLVVLCPVIIWFARYPIAELITGLLAFIGFYAFLRMMQSHREPLAYAANTDDGVRISSSDRIQSGPWSIFWGGLSGLALGQIALARSDFIFYLVPIVPYLLYWRLTRSWRPAYSWFAGGLLLMLALFLVHFFFFSFGYTLDLFHNVLINLRRLWSPLLLALYIGLPLLLFVDRLHPRLSPFGLRLGRLVRRYRAVFLVGLTLLLGGYALYHYIIAPWLPNVRVDSAGRPIVQQVITTWESYIGAPVDTGERYNLLRIGWYLSPLGMFLGVIGLLRFIWNRLSAGTGLFFGVFLVLSFVFLEESYTDPHYIYTMRRYIAVMLPGLLLGAAWVCQFLWSRFRPKPVGVAAASLLATGLAVFFVYTSQTIIRHVEEKDAVDQLTTLAERIPPRTVVLFSQERDQPFVVATPLQYVFGIDSFVLNRSYPAVRNDVIEGMVTRWRSDGYNVWVVMGANGGKLNLPNFALKEEGTWDYDVPEFEQLQYQKPYNVSRSYLPWGLYSVQPRTSEEGLPLQVDIGVMDYKWLVSGFYLQEKSERDSSPWRWTGDHAVMRLPLDTSADGRTYKPATITLRLRPETPVAGQNAIRTDPVQVRLSLDDTSLTDISVSPGSGFEEYSVAIPAGIPVVSDASSEALLHIRTTAWSPGGIGSGADQRALGIQIDAVDVTGRMGP